MHQDPSLHADPGTATVFRLLAEIVYADEDYERIYQLVCEAAPRVVSGCDHASLMLRRGGGRLVTSGASDAVARAVDDLERALGEGPCVDAIEEDAVYVDTDLAVSSRWPKLAKEVLATTPVRGMAGFTLRIGTDQVGALNLFSDTPGGLSEQSVDQGVVLAAFASVAAYAAQERRRATTLRDGLDSNREIGKAVGLMMAFHRVNDQAAFDLLRQASQDMNVKVVEVARQVVDHHNSRGETGLEQGPGGAGTP